MATEEQTEEKYTLGLYPGNNQRVTQKLTVPDRTITHLSLKGARFGSPPGVAYYRIRKLDDEIIASVSFIPGDWSEALEWREYAFDTPVLVNEEVRIGIDYTDAGADVNNRVNVRMALNVKADEMISYYKTEWIDQVLRDFTYIYTYSTATGWSGKISGVTNPAKVMGVDKTNIAKVKGVA